MSVWKPLVVCPSPETGRKLRTVLAEAGIPGCTLLAAYPAPGAIAALAAQHGCNLCLIELAADEEKALLAIGEVSPAMPVVALPARQDAGLILRCLRRGAREFLPDISAEPLRDVLDRLDGIVGADARRQGKVYCVVPGKPGCGASTLAVHLAAEERSSGARVLLVDADPVAAGIAFLLKLRSEYHFGDVLRDWKRMDDDLWTRIVTPWRGIDVVLAPEDPATRCPVVPELAAEFAAFWRKRYDLILLDAPDAYTAAAAGYSAAADLVLLVSTNELAALHATRRGIDLLAQTPAARSRLRLILNRYAPSTGLAREDIRTVLQIEPFAALSNDYDALQAAILDGKPAAASSRFGAAVRGLSLALRGAPPAPRKSNWLSRLAARK